MPYADVENGPSEDDIPWYAHYNTWEELYAEHEKDMEAIQFERHEVFVDGGGPVEYRKMLVERLVDALIEYGAGEYLPGFDEDLGRAVWTKVDRDDQIWEAVMSLAYYDWIRKHSDMFDPAMWEAEHL